MSFFSKSREKVMETIAELGLARCVYAHPEGPEGWVNGHCDCKYGFKATGMGPGSEQTGCPELRATHSVLSVMTDDEWLELTHRANGIVT